MAPSDGGLSHLKKAQPQVPSNTRYQTASPAKELPPYEAPPVYENIQDVHYSEINKGKARPQVPATYYNSTNINGGDYVVMTGKLGPQQGQKTASYIPQKLERTQNYDNLFQRSYDPNLCNKYLANSLDQENSKCTYVPPSELQQAKNYTYEQPQPPPQVPQQTQYVQRSNIPYNSEPSAVRYAPEPQYQHYRSATIDGPTPHNHYRPDNVQMNKQYMDPAPTSVNSLNAGYYNDAQSRSLPVYSNPRAGEQLSR